MGSKMMFLMNQLRKMQPNNLVSKTQFGNFSQSYSTNTRNKVSLYSKISPLGNPNANLAPELDDWVKNGNKVRFAELQRIVHDLRKRRRFSQALQVSEWMNKKGDCEFSPVEHAVQLDLIGKVNGYVSAESYFNNLHDDNKTDKTYGALLHCYVRQRQTDKSLSHLQKMKDMGFTLSPRTYNDIMCLYSYIGQNDKVLDMLNEMKKNGVSPDNLTFRICLNAHGAKSDIEGMENCLKEMESQPNVVMDWNTYAVMANLYIKAGLIDKANEALKKSETKLEKKDSIGYNHLISLHARLGNTSDVLRLWGLEKGACKRCINKDYITMLESLVKLDEFEETEKLLNEWELSGNCYDFRVPNTVIAGYIEKGSHEKAETILENLVEKEKTTTPDSWGKVAKGYVEKGEMRKAINCVKAAISLHVEGKKWKLNPKVITGVLDYLGENGSVEEVDAFVASLRTVMSVNKQMYHAMIKAYVRGGKEVDGVLNDMKADKIDEDDEIKKIVSANPEKV